jgi:Tol biopolymer transport system component
MANVVPTEFRPELPPGTRVGHYTIVGELGRGGLGVVYRARDDALGRDVALKSPLPDHASEEDRHRFLVEARAAARLSHPAILPIFEAFEDGDRPWLAMALADGRSLRAELTARGALPLEEVLSHAESLADALDAAHTKHVLHRDVTPNNIFLTPEGRVVLMDFGLARFFVIPGEESKTSTSDGSDRSSGDVAGTPGYMSPEQLLARPLGPATDIFGLGAVLYEAITGHRAFPGNNGGEILDATLHQNPPPIVQFVRGAPPELDRILHKALAKRPDERYATARDLLVDVRTLRRRLEGKEGQGVVRTSWHDRTRPFLPLGIVAAAAIVSVVAWAMLRQSGLPEGRPRQLTDAPGWEADPAIAPDGSFVAYAAEQNGNVDIWVVDARGGDPLQLTHDPGVDRRPVWSADSSAIVYVSNRGEGDGIWKVPRLGGSPVQLVADAQDPAISPDGTRIAFARVGQQGKLRIFVAPLADPESARMITGDGDGDWNHEQPSWSPDGTRVAYAAQRDLWLVPASGGGARRLTTDGEYDRDPAWSPTGRFVYFSSYREGTEALWRVAANGGRGVRVTPGTGPEIHPSVSGDGTRLAYSTRPNTSDIVVHELANGNERRIGILRYATSPVLTADRRAIVFVSDRVDGRLSLWLQALSADGDPTGTPRRLTDHPGTVSRPAVSPDGRWVAYYRVLDGQRDIWVVPIAGGAPQRFTEDPASDVHPEWSPDGRSLVFVSGRSGSDQIWIGPVSEGKPAGPPRQLTTTAVSPLAPVWSAEGSQIAFMDSDARGMTDIWVAAVGGGPSLRVTNGASAQRVRWDWQRPDTLLVSGFWNEPKLSVRRVSAGGHADAVPNSLAWLGESVLGADFDVSRDGRFLVFGRQTARGDVWLSEARRGKY